MKQRNFFLLPLFLLAQIFFVQTSFAQQDSLASLLRKYDTYRNTQIQEKIYLHLDRTFYLTGETLWFKAYYVDGTFHRPLNLSKIAYVEILNKENHAVLQTKIGLDKGNGNGALFLPASLASGNYLVRAYTSWMKNFSTELYFQAAITVVNPFTKLGLTFSKEAPKYDVQFFPEGGNMIAGIKSKIAFRAVDASGKGVDFGGSIIDDRNDTIAHFKPLKFGIGNFMFTPVSGQTYKAVMHDRKNNVSTYSLPSVHDEGFALSVSDSIPDNLQIAVSSKLSDATDASWLILAVHTAQTTLKCKVLFLKNGKASSSFDLKTLGEGISHITLFNSNLVPVCERLYFKQPQKLLLEAHVDQAVLSSRKKVTLDFLAREGNNMAANANLSVSVFKVDSLQSAEQESIEGYLWLNAELKGTIESAAWYLNDNGPEVKKATDNLMLTHGWSRFTWKDVVASKPRTFEFIPESHGHIITGKIKGGDPTVPKRIITYLSAPDKNIRLYPSKSTYDGTVHYELREFFGPRKIIAQTNIQVDSIYDIEINSPFSKTLSSWKYPFFDFSETLKNQVTQRSLHMQVQNVFHDEKNDFVRVPSIDTTAFYGIANEQYWLDDYTRFPTMEEVMREYVAGVRVRKRKGKFHFVTLDNLNNTLFKDNPMVLLDGVPVFNIDKIMAIDPKKIKKLEVMTRMYYLGPLSFEGVVSYTTYSGDLSDFELDRRSLVIDYDGLQVHKEFFSPKYETDQQKSNRIPDARTLVYWQPVLYTNEDGKQQCTFYTPDIDGKYKVVVQGLSSNGKAGRATTTIEVDNKRIY